MNSTTNYPKTIRKITLGSYSEFKVKNENELLKLKNKGIKNNFIEKLK